jgi:AcrR family transcriptional regulator
MEGWYMGNPPEKQLHYISADERVNLYKKCVTEKTAIQQKQITESLLQLMQVKPFPEITVTQLCQHAGVSRRMFYYLFTNISGALYALIDRKILEVDEYRDRFLTRLGLMYQRITVPNMQAELDECIALIAPEMPIHFERWAEYNDKKINSDSPLSADGAMRYWKERIRRMREETMVMRPYNLYGFVQEEFKLSDEDMIYYFGGPRGEKPEI